MLKEISIKNFVLINEAKLEFTNDLNILIGETGGGKSLVFRAISQLLGQRSQTSYIQKEKDYYEIKGIFTNDSQIITKLEQEKIGVLDNLYITRKLTKKKQLKITVNGEIVSLNRLVNITSSIADIVLQKENNQEIAEEFLVSLMNVEQNVYSSYLNSFAEYKKLKALKRDLEVIRDNQEERLLVINHRIKELEVLKNIDSPELISQKVKGMESYFQSAKLYNEVISGVDGAINSLIIKNDVDEEISEKIIEIKDELESLSFKMSQKINQDYSEDEYVKLKDDLSKIKKLERRYQMEIRELKNYEDELRLEKDQINSVDIDLENIESKLKKVKVCLEKFDQKLLNEYKVKSKNLCNEINKSFKDVEMKNASVKYDFLKLSDYGIYGSHQVTMVIDANGLNKYENVNLVTSGGEYSRLLLILKVLENNHDGRLLMFDEIDTGISGYAAQKMVKMIQKITKNHQVILITHLAQTAAASDSMFEVSKVNSISSIEKINSMDKASKIANLLSGSEVTTAAIKQANKLIEEVQ